MTRAAAEPMRPLREWAAAERAGIRFVLTDIDDIRPGFVTEAAGGAGFAEFAELLLS